ncbi:glycoside hydrolase family 108 protein [Tepidimonas charontis]|nr:glycosyl hydrolase 108 family protein [Tepidimonas charontis]
MKEMGKMADFLPAFERMIQNEGGYVLHDVPGDRGGQTYAGIARNRHPDWRGWREIDAGREPEAEAVREFYREHFWRPLQGEAIRSQAIAQTLFDFAVNAGVKTAVVLAQAVLGGLTPDGKLGPKTLAALNEADEALFIARYALAKIARYAELVRRDRSQAKFLLGWINRTLKEAA